MAVSTSVVDCQILGKSHGLQFLASLVIIIIIFLISAIYAVFVKIGASRFDGVQLFIL